MRQSRGKRSRAPGRELAKRLNPKISRVPFDRATKKIKTFDQNMITEEQARTMPRFEFIAHWLEFVTRKKAGRELTQGKRVKHTREGLWQIVYSNGLVEYETPDVARLYEYARRGTLGWHIRNAEEFRVLAYQRAQP